LTVRVPKWLAACLLVVIGAVAGVGVTLLIVFGDESDDSETEARTEAGTDTATPPEETTDRGDIGLLLDALRQYNERQSDFVYYVDICEGIRPGDTAFACAEAERLGPLLNAPITESFPAIRERVGPQCEQALLKEELRAKNPDDFPIPEDAIAACQREAGLPVTVESPFG
jgi:hypothetical protein